MFVLTYKRNRKERITALKKNIKQKNKDMLLPLAAALCLVSVIVMIVVLAIPKEELGEFNPPPFDTSAQVGIPIVPDDLGWNELDAQAFKASVCGKIVANGNTADVWLTNPESNTVWLKLRVLDVNGNALGETGLIKPGEYVQSVTLNTVPKVGSPIVLKLMAYQPDTYYSEGVVSLNTTISEGGTK